MRSSYIATAAALACGAIWFAAPAQGATCMKPAGGKQAASNRHGVIYSKGNDRKSWFGCSFRFGRTVLLEVSDPEERVSATVKPEFIRLRMTVVPEGNESGCEKTTIRVNSTSTRSGRKRQLFYQNCKRTEGDRKYKSQPLGILLQRGPAAASTARSRCTQPVGSHLARRNANGIVWTILDGNRYTGRRSWYGCSYSYGATVRFHFPAYTSSLTSAPVDKELGVTISDRRSVRKISRWTVQLFDWEVIEGCNVNQTNPATYRASFVTGKGKQVETGYTCDDEEY